MLAAIAAGVAGVAGGVALTTGALNTSIDCYQDARGYAPVVDGASCAGSAVGLGIDAATLASVMSPTRSCGRSGVMSGFTRAERRNIASGAQGTVEVAGNGFGRGVQRLF